MTSVQGVERCLTGKNTVGQKKFQEQAYFGRNGTMPYKPFDFNTLRGSPSLVLEMAELADPGGR
jgi:hypothetical protein